MGRSGKAKPVQRRKSALVAPVKLTLTHLLIGVAVALALTVVAARSLASSPPPPSPPTSGDVRVLDLDSQRRVYVLDNFFDPAQADEWRAMLRREWDAGHWYYTTNNPGTFDPHSGNHNQKVISRSKVEERHRVAQQLRQAGAFSYSKWELPRDNPAHLALKRHMESEPVRRRVEEVLGVRLKPRMGDFFTSLYREGDFLSSHTDAYGGTWAAVVYLSEGEGEGGELTFYCAEKRSWCTKLGPGSNRLVLFKTRNPEGPMHRVEQVRTSGNFFRWGGTGWYDEVTDVLTPFEAAERDKMRNPTFLD